MYLPVLGNIRSLSDNTSLLSSQASFEILKEPSVEVIKNV